MTAAKAHIRIAPDGTLTGKTTGLPPGEHEAQITLLGRSAGSRFEAAELLARVRRIQAELARLPVLDKRSPDELIGYNEQGHFD
jgi:hypothetical protein